MRRVIALLFFALAPYAAGQTTEIDRLAQETMQQWNLPGLAVAVVKDDRILLAKGYGLKETGGTSSVTPDTLFQLGSDSKAFTAAAMAILVDEKKLAWDDPVRQHVVYFHLDDACADSLVTLRDLVSHRTGLSRHDELWDNSGLSREDVIRAIGHVALTKPIRSTYQYNNIMFMTAGEAVAQASGMPWSDFVRTRIFAPLGMSHSVATTSGWLASKDRATGHRFDAKSGANLIRPFVDYDNLGPAGNISSSANDMAQWLRYQLANKSEALAETKRPQMIIPVDSETSPDTSMQSYGMGWNVYDNGVVAHGGALNGFRAQVALLPKEHAGIAIMTNTGRGYAIIALRAALLDRLLGRETRDWNRYYLEIEKKHAEPKKREWRRDTHPSRELAAYSGTYEHPGYGRATISVENDALVLRWLRHTIPLVHEQYDTFNAVSEPEEIDEDVQFALGTNGEVNTLTMFGQVFVRSAGVPATAAGTAALRSQLPARSRRASSRSPAWCCDRRWRRSSAYAHPASS